MPSTRRHAIVVWLASCLAAPCLAGGVAIVGWELEDNGDHDGYADTRETVALRLTVRNTTPFFLRDVVLRLSAASPAIECIGRPIVAAGNLEAGETVRLASTFAFTVGDVDRTSLGVDAYGELSARFDAARSAPSTR